MPWESFSLKARREVPKGLWMRCPSCEAMIYKKMVAERMNVCPECGRHFRLGSRDRVEQLADTGTFEEFLAGLVTEDPLKFRDRKTYQDRLKAERKKTGIKDAMVTGKCFIKGRPVILGVMEPNFIMASMGSVVGEKVAECFRRGKAQNIPVIVVTCSGGARMQEGMISLMQMAKTSAAAGELDAAGGLYIAVFTDPTTAGVAASFAYLADVILAEPGAQIGFAGPRVILNTIRTELPEGFQTAEFCKDHGFIDRIVPRKELRNEIARIIDYCGK